jgi:hypothetical protein
MRANEFINEAIPSLASVLKAVTKVPTAATAAPAVASTTKPAPGQTVSTAKTQPNSAEINKLAKTPIQPQTQTQPQTDAEEKTKIDMSRLKPGQEIDFPNLGKVKVIRSTPTDVELDTSMVPGLQLPKIKIDPKQNF